MKDLCDKFIYNYNKLIKYNQANNTNKYRPTLVVVEIYWSNTKIYLKTKNELEQGFTTWKLKSLTFNKTRNNSLLRNTAKVPN